MFYESTDKTFSDGPRNNMWHKWFEQVDMFVM